MPILTSVRSVPKGQVVFVQVLCWIPGYSEIKSLSHFSLIMIPLMSQIRKFDKCIVLPSQWSHDNATTKLPHRCAEHDTGGFGCWEVLGGQSHYSCPGKRLIRVIKHRNSSEPLRPYPYFHFCSTFYLCRDTMVSTFDVT